MNSMIHDCPAPKINGYVPRKFVTLPVYRGQLSKYASALPNNKSRHAVVAVGDDDNTVSRIDILTARTDPLSTCTILDLHDGNQICSKARAL